jgi:ribokinase
VNAADRNPPLVLSLGSINADFQMRIDRRPELSETLLARDFMRLGGGKAANVAYLARRLGRDAVLLGRVGDDDLSEQALAPLREAGVGLQHVARVRGADTAVSIITVPPDGKKGIILAPNANDLWEDGDPDRLDKIIACAPAGSILVIDSEVPGFVTEAAARSARRCGLCVLLDPSPADRVSDSLLRLVDVAVPNASEAETLTGIAVDGADTATRAARVLLDRGCKAVCIKLLDGGCVAARGEDVCHVTGGEVEVVDTTGAGDAFAGAMAVALSEGQDFIAAAVFAAAAANHAVTGYGSQPAYPGRDDIERISATITVSTLRE